MNVSSRFSKTLRAAFGLALVLATLASCQAIFDLSAGAKLTLEFPRSKDVSAKSVDFSLITEWRLRLTGPGPDVDKTYPAGTTGATLEDIIVGTWTIAVDGIDASDVSIYHSEREVTLKQGDNAVSLTLAWTEGLAIARIHSESNLVDSTGRSVLTSFTTGIATTPDRYSDIAERLQGDYYIRFDSTADVSTNGGSIQITMSGGKPLYLGDVFTIAMWIFPVPATNTFKKQVIVSNQPGTVTGGFSTGSGFTLSYNTYGGGSEDGALFFETADGTERRAFKVDSAIKTNTWQHVAVAVDKIGGVARVYLNGTLASTVTEGPEFLASFLTSQYIQLGGMMDGVFFYSGRMDDVCFYGGALDAAQVQALIGQSAFAGGSGIAADPYRVANPQQLSNVRWLLDRAYVLANSAPLNMSSYEWVPIGTEASPFTGTFDGAGREIGALNINANDAFLFDSAGLFGYTRSATLKNIRLSNAAVSVTYAPTGAVGALAGIAVNTDILNCAASVMINPVNDIQKVGGLVGQYEVRSGAGTRSIVGCSANAIIVGGGTIGGLIGWVSAETGSTCLIQDCSSSGSASSTRSGSIVGGLVGQLDPNTRTERSWSSANCAGERSVGGFVGYAYQAAIEACYAKGNATYPNAAFGGNGSSGGFAGWVSSGASIKNCYSLGNVENQATVVNKAGAFIGWADNSTVVERCYGAGCVISPKAAAGGFWGGSSTVVPSYCHYDHDANTFDPMTYDAKDRTTPEMIVRGTFASWDIADEGITSSSLWVIRPGSYPYLRWQGTANIPIAPLFVKSVNYDNASGKVSQLLEAGDSISIRFNQPISRDSIAPGASWPVGGAGSVFFNINEIGFVFALNAPSWNVGSFSAIGNLFSGAKTDVSYVSTASLSEGDCVLTLAFASVGGSFNFGTATAANNLLFTPSVNIRSAYNTPITSSTFTPTVGTIFF